MRSERSIAGLVAVLVVVGLEVVEVEEDERERQRAQSASPCVEEAGDRLVERQPIPDAGERVATSDQVQLAVQLRDVGLLAVRVSAQPAQRELLLEHRARPALREPMADQARHRRHERRPRSGCPRRCPGAPRRVGLSTKATASAIARDQGRDVPALAPREEQPDADQDDGQLGGAQHLPVGGQGLAEQRRRRRRRAWTIRPSGSRRKVPRCASERRTALIAAAVSENGRECGDAARADEEVRGQVDRP